MDYHFRRALAQFSETYPFPPDKIAASQRLAHYLKKQNVLPGIAELAVNIFNDSDKLNSSICPLSFALTVEEYILASPEYCKCSTHVKIWLGKTSKVRIRKIAGSCLHATRN